MKIIVVLFLMSIVTDVIADAKWEQYSDDPDEVVFIDRNSVALSVSDLHPTVTVMTKTVFRIKQQSIHNRGNTTIMLIEEKVDCMTHRIANQSEQDFDKDGNEIDSQIYDNPDFKLPKTGSYMANFVGWACG